VDTKLSIIIGQYRAILIDDGIIPKEELIEMLKADYEILDKYNTREKLNKLADKILNFPNKYAGKGLVEAKAERLKLYKQGLSDVEIADIQGLTVSAIANWRGKNRLHTNSKPNKLSDAENKTRMELYKQGLFDKDIAEKLNLTRQTVLEWRKIRKLPSNRSLKAEERKSV